MCFYRVFLGFPRVGMMFYMFFLDGLWFSRVFIVFGFAEL